MICLRFLHRESGVDYFEMRPHFISINSRAHEYFINEYRLVQRYENRGIIVANDEYPKIEENHQFVTKLKVFFGNLKKGKERSFRIRTGTDAYAYFLAEHSPNIVKDFDGNIIVPTPKVMEKVI